MKEVYVHSGITGGHWAFQTETAKTPFTNKITEAMSVTLKKTDVVVDIGAYVGEYSLYAHNCGVKKITCYEPTPETFKLLTRNVKEHVNATLKNNIVAVNKAVTGKKCKSVTLHISSGIGVTNSIAKSDRKASSKTVMAVDYATAVRKATVVKIDVEGAEYSYPIVQPNLRAIILEFHPIVGRDWQKDAKEIIKQIRKAGFKPLCEPGFTHGWDMHGAWVKK